MDILFLTHYFPPEVGAPQTRIFEIARRLQSRGHNIRILTGFPNYPTGVIPEPYRGHWLMREDFQGLSVVRTWVYATPNTGFARRLLNHLSFVTSSLTGIYAVGGCDVVITEVPPLFTPLAGFVLAVLKRAKHVENVADLWPESAIGMGVLRQPLLIRLSRALARFIHTRSSMITVTALGQRDRLIAEYGLEPRKVVYIPNGTDTQLFRPFEDLEVEEIRTSLGNRFIVLYGGTHGLAHGLEIVLEAAGILRDYDDILFLFVGEGADKPRLVQQARQQQLANVLFLDQQPKSRMPYIVNAADICLVPLRRIDIFKGVLPSKMFEYMACAKPILLSVEGNAKEVVERAQAGFCVEPENPEAMAEAVLRLRDDRKLRRQLGTSGRQFVEREHSRDQIALLLADALEHLVNTGEPPPGAPMSASGPV